LKSLPVVSTSHKRDKLGSVVCVLKGGHNIPLMRGVPSCFIGVAGISARRCLSSSTPFPSPAPSSILTTATAHLGADGKTDWKFLKNHSVGIIGVPFSGGQGKKGVDQGPSRMITAGLIPQLEQLGWNVSIDSDFEKFLQLNPGGLDTTIEQEKLRNAWNVAEATRETANAVKETLSKGKFALTIGGDHSVAIGTIAGTSAVFDDYCVVWVDAHGDINTPSTTSSGNLHGCVLSFHFGLDNANTVEGFEWVRPTLSPNRLVYIGLRDLDPAEKQIIKYLGIKAFSMHEVDKYGIGKVMEMALNHVNPKGDLPIHLSFDVDAVDPSEIPSTGTPVRGGLTFREAHFVAEAVSETGLLVAMDLMEVNPALGDIKSAEKTVQIANSLVRCALGETLL
jgi:arginase